MSNIKRALVPGSFDPITLGHYDLAIRAAKIFDEVYVVAFVNAEKRGRFTNEERLEMLEASFVDVPNVRCELSTGMLADYAVEHGINALVKGARNATDFDYELTLSMINRSVEPELDTIVLPTRQEYMQISSTMVSEMIKYGRDYSCFVPAGAAEVIARILTRRG
ncbi:MAG: pantetheine-phosphate adenylyltransferase [Clostridiales bacterium]|nr:pantetheine-phosphate adenylyltransferase [Clostridiales bacterium]